MSGEEGGVSDWGSSTCLMGGGEGVPELGIVLRFWPSGWVR